MDADPGRGNKKQLHKGRLSLPHQEDVGAP